MDPECRACPKHFFQLNKCIFELLMVITQVVPGTDGLKFSWERYDKVRETTETLSET